MTPPPPNNLVASANFWSVGKKEKGEGKKRERGREKKGKRKEKRGKGKKGGKRKEKKKGEEEGERKRKRGRAVASGATQ